VWATVAWDETHTFPKLTAGTDRWCTPGEGLQRDDGSPRGRTPVKTTGAVSLSSNFSTNGIIQLYRCV